MSILSQAAGLGAAARSSLPVNGPAPAPVRFADFSSPRAVARGEDIPRLNRAEDIQLIRTEGAEPQLLLSLGARQAKSGWWVSRGPGRFPFDDLRPYLPRYAQKVIVPDVVDLIPSTTWYASLANVLVERSWDGLREETSARSGGCEICGVKSGIECHEKWEYDHEGFVQKLVALEAVCAPCHETRHLGFANVRGRLPVVLDRLCVVNRIREEEKTAFYDVIAGAFQWRSQHEWDLDVSILEGRKLRLRRALEHVGEGRIGGKAKDRIADFWLVGTTFSVGPKGIVLS